MRQNRVFFPQEFLDPLFADDKAELHGQELSMHDDGRRYTVEEAVHIVTDAAGGSDPMSLVGKVKTREQLRELDAELMETSLIIGDDAYDVVPGFVGIPLGAGAEAAAATAATLANEEDLLAQFLLKSL